MIVYLEMIDGPEARSKFEVIYDRYHRLMLYVANKILGNQQDAEDAVHDAFLAILQNLEKISDPRCPKTRAFVVTITERKAIDLYRKKQRRQDDVLWEETQGLEVPYEGEDALAQAILKLPARYREWILLKYHQGYSNEELAKIFGLSRHAAYKLDRRAKERLEALCREEGLL